MKRLLRDVDVNNIKYDKTREMEMEWNKNTINIDTNTMK